MKLPRLFGKAWLKATDDKVLIENSDKFFVAALRLHLNKVYASLGGEPSELRAVWNLFNRIGELFEKGSQEVAEKFSLTKTGGWIKPLHILTQSGDSIADSWDTIDRKRGIWLYVSIIPSSLATAPSWFSDNASPSASTLVSWLAAHRPMGYLVFHHDIVNLECPTEKIKVVAHILLFTEDSAVNFGVMPLESGGKSARLLCPLAVVPIDILSTEERTSLGL